MARDTREQDPRGITPRHNNLRRAIKARGFTQDRFSEFMGRSDGTTHSTVDRWLHGAPKPGQNISNADLARAARMLGVSVWYLLDLTDSEDGSGARPFEQNATMLRWWKVAQDPARCSCWRESEDPEDPVKELWAHMVTREGGRAAVAESMLYDECEAEEALEAAMASAKGKAGGELSKEESAALSGERAYLEWCRDEAAEQFKKQIVDVRGDYRDPRGVVAALLDLAEAEGYANALDASLVELGRPVSVSGNKGTRTSR